MRSLVLSLFAVFFAVFSRGAEPYGLTSRPAFTAFNGGRLPTNSERVAGEWSTEIAFPGLTFLNPLGLAQMPGTTRLVVWEREGRVYSFENDRSATSKTLMLDISNVTQGWDDSGLLGLAFHPNFASNHYVFLYYTYVAPGTVEGSMYARPPTYKANRDRLSRFQVNTSGIIDPASETIFVDQISTSIWHNGGGMFFHPDDGFLYFTNGDDANGRAQIMNSGLHSGVFRIDVDQRGGSISHAPPRAPLPEGSVAQHYFIPNDNPFVGMEGVLEEYFCIGLRNPHRMTIDPVTKRIFIGDVGDAQHEEIDVIEPGEKGLNFQWNKIEGYGGDLTPPYVGINRRPLLDYSHSDGNAVVGGYIYRGTEFPELVGKYLFGDNGTGRIYYADESTTPATKVLLATMPDGPGPRSASDYTGLSSFGVDANGELYLCQLSSTAGRICKLVRGGTPVHQMPAKLSDTGVFGDLATLSPATGFVSYDVNTPLWSDGAVKRRWFAIPTGKTVGFTAEGEWTFPEGSVFVKHFELPINESKPAQTKRIETRVLVRNDQGYIYGGSYKWRADGSDADLVLDRTVEDETITKKNGGTRIQTWTFPGRQDCLTCHTQASGGVLGLNTPQNNRAHLFPETSVTDNQLRAWSHAGYFSSAIVESTIPDLTRLRAIDDKTASAEQRARSYLDANCAHCHRPGGVNATWDARIETPLAEAGILNGFVTSDLGLPGARVVVPGKVGQSILHRRLSSLVVGTAMPPLAKGVLDQPAIAVIADWIGGISSRALKTLPAGWKSGDVGAPALAGYAEWSEEAVTLFGSGSDISGGHDSFHFLSRELTGNGQLLARVVSVGNTDPSAKAGVMIRDGLKDDARHGMTIVTRSQGVAFQRRETVGGDSATTGTTGAAPTWVRIQRAGSEIVSSRSADGTAWTEIGRATIPMAQKVRIGLCFTSHNDASFGSAAFDHVTFLPNEPFAVSTPPKSTLAKVGGSATFDVQSLGDLPDAYQWMHNGLAIAGATSAQLTVSNAELKDAGAYRVVLGKAVVSPVATLAVVGEAQFNATPAPGATAVLAIPAAGSGVSYQWLKDNVPLANDARIAGAKLARLTIKNFSAADAGDYTCVATLADTTQTLGPYHVRLLLPPANTTGTPPAAIVSGAISWQLQASEPLTTFVVKGLPRGLRYDAATNRIVGTPEVNGDFNVTVTARNAAGQSAPQTYTLHVEAFPAAIVGNYVALVPRNAAVNGQIGGLVRFTVGKVGAGSGKLFYAGDTAATALKGRVIAAPGGGAAVEWSLRRKTGSPLTLRLDFNTTVGSMSGVLGLDGQTVSFSAKRTLAAASATGLTATYNVRLRAPSGGSGPQGSGWLRVTVARTGEVRGTGKLADGSTATFGTVLAADQSVPVFFPLYGGRGSVIGTPTLTANASLPPADFGGALDWRKFSATGASDRTYASGFSVQLTALGRRYRVPATGTQLLGLPNAPGNARIEFSAGGVAEAAQGAQLDQTFRLTIDGSALFSTGAANPAAVAMTINLTSGAFAGTFRLKDGTVSRSSTYRGLFVPGETVAEGFFLLPQLPTTATAPILSGLVEIQAP